MSTGKGEPAIVGEDGQGLVDLAALNARKIATKHHSEQSGNHQRASAENSTCRARIRSEPPAKMDMVLVSFICSRSLLPASQPRCGAESAPDAGPTHRRDRL